MGFNLGAFAGGMAQSGVNAYKTMEDIQSQKKRDEMLELQTQQMRDEMKGKEALRSAIAEQGDMNTVTPGALMAGPAPQGLPQEGGYTTPEVAASEKLARVRQRALEGGADPTAVMQFANAQRADTAAFNTDKAFEWMRGIDKTVTEKGLAAAAKEHLIPEYNKNKGTLNDGLTAHLLEDKKGTFVQFKDKDGKVVRTEPLNMQTFNMARDEVGASMLAAAGPEHFYKSREYGLKSREVAAKEGELGVHKEFYGKGGTYERVAGQRANAGGDKSIKAKAGEYAEALVDAGAINPATKKPYTAQEAKQYALGVALKDPNAKMKAEWKSVAGNPDIQENSSGVQREWDPKTERYKVRGLPQVNENAAKLGVRGVFDSRLGEVGYMGGDGNVYTTEQEALEASTKTAVKPAPGIPRERVAASPAAIEASKKFGGVAIATTPAPVTPQEVEAARRRYTGY